MWRRFQTEVSSFPALVANQAMNGDKEAVKELAAKARQIYDALQSSEMELAITKAEVARLKAENDFMLRLLNEERPRA